MAKILLATGGTGGHIYPALAVAAAAAERGHESLLLGAADGLEARLAADAGVPFRGVPAGKWRRDRPSLAEAWRALRGLVAARAVVADVRPDVALGFGGFASFPGVAAAAFGGVPIVLAEGNAMPGRVTRWFARRARAVALALPETRDHLPRGVRTEITGWPVRPDRLPQAEARRRLALPLDATLTLVLGGSQGSVALNEVVPSVFPALAGRTAVLHQTGERWLEAVRASLPGDAGEEGAGAFSAYRLTPWVDATVAWSAADLAITRAGIGTLSEAASHGVPVIAVPLPSSADDHQRHNARAVAAAGAGAYVEQDDPAALERAWRTLLEPRARAAAAVAARRRAAPDAALATVELIEALLAPPTPPEPTPNPARRTPAPSGTEPGAGLGDRA